MTKKITVVIPAFNEALSIGVVVKEVIATYPDLVEEVIVVNDGSTDDTAQIATQSGARVISHPYNLGYGASLKTAIHQTHTDYVLTMDADGQHRTSDIARLSAAMQGNDMVIGQRQGLIHSQAWRMPGKWLLGMLANYLSPQPIPDLNSGLRLIRRDKAQKYIHLCPSGFSFSTTITMVMINRGYRVAFVPIEVNKRTGKSTVSIATGFNTIILILRIASLFNPLKVFLPISFFCIAAGLLWGVRYVLGGSGVSVASMLAIVTGILFFALGLICDQVSQLRLERYE